MCSYSSEYSVEYDIVYDEKRRECHFNNERKSVFDFYVPKNVQRESIPVVLFVHGGGWRRGDKSAWKYFLSRDINFLVALINLLFGLYGNVGKALARRGIACAVMSYPLTKLSTSWLLLELTTSYMSSLFIVAVLIGIIITILLFSWTLMTCGFIRSCLIPQKPELGLVALGLVFLTNLLILLVITLQRDNHKLTRFHVCLIWIALLTSLIVLPNTYSLVGLTLISLAIGQGILLRTNLQVCTLSLENQVESVVKCMKKIKEIGDDTKGFNPKDFYLMGHSAGGHLCSIAALCDEYLKDQGMSNVDITGVITISPVLQLSSMDTIFSRPLYLYPTFGNSPDQWLKRCPSQNLMEQTENNYIPPFLIVTAERDIKIIKDGACDFHRESNKRNEGMSDHVIFPKTNHVSIICNFDKTINNWNLADLCSNFIKRSVT